jgi:hypothetical protein
VRDGGTSEPTVQLKGSGSTGRGSHQGDTAEQLLDRARNLALKANLLSDELAKPQP